MFRKYTSALNFRTLISVIISLIATWIAYKYNLTFNLDLTLISIAVVFPLVFNFFTTIAPDGVEISTDISSFLNFVIKMFFAFGLAFEVPILTVLVIKFGLSTYESLSKKRPYIVVAAFVIGMLLTPPDVISQVLLAIPIWILFELGLFMSKFITKPKSNKKDQASKRFDKLDNDDLDSDEY